MESPKLTRRTLLKAGAGAAAFATTSNIFTPLKTFAARDQKLIFWLQPNFNPTADKILEDQARAFAKQAGLKDSELQILKVPGGEIPTRMAAALEVNAPPDVTRLEEGYVARMRAQKALLDITDIMAEMKKVPGGVNPSVIPLTEDGGRNFAVPMGLNPEVMHARMDLLEQAGYSSFPETWDKFVEASLKINKPPFYAYGMALGTSPGNDSTEDIMATVWANGGNIIDKQNRVVFNSPGAVKGFQLIKDMYLKHQIIPKGTLSWDNSGNNKAYQSKQVAFVYNPPSVYSYLLQEDKETAAKTGPLPGPGRTGRPREARLRRLLRRLQGQPVPRHRQGAHPPLRRAEELQRVHHGDGRPVPADLSEAPGRPVLVVQQGVRGPGRHRQERRDDRARGCDHGGPRRGGRAVAPGEVGPDRARQQRRPRGGRGRGPRGDRRDLQAVQRAGLVRTGRDGPCDRRPGPAPTGARRRRRGARAGHGPRRCGCSIS